MIEQSTSEDLVSGHNFNRLFTQAPAPIAIYKGRELKYVFANNAYLQIFNCRDILGKTLKEAFPELEGQLFVGSLENVFNTGTPFYDNEIPALIDLHDNGNLVTRYYSIVYSPYRTDDGVIEGVMALGHDVTDRAEARKKERESDLRFRNIVEQSTEPILILKGRDMVLDVANTALFELWNVGKEALNKPFLEILPEMKGQGFYDLLLDVYVTGTTHYGVEVPATFKRSNGVTETVYINFIYQPYREADGNISGVLVLATTVTEQVLAKQKLKQSDNNFQNMILQAPVAMCVIKGPNHVVEIANDRMYELWGKPESEMAGKSIFEGLPEVKDQGFEKILHDVYTSGDRFIAGEQLVKLPRNGTIEDTYINFLYEPFREGDGSISGIIAVATEVTEQVVARHKIEYAEENARLAIELADLGTYEIDVVADKVAASPRVRAIWGVDMQLDQRLDFASFIHPDDRARRARANNEALVTGNLDYEARINRQDGSLRWVRVKGKMLYDKETPARLLGVVQDITEQKLFAEELSKQVEERTIELKQANERLWRSNEELEQFAYVTSHDLQEPLRKIQIFSNILIEHQDRKEDVKKYLDKVNSAAKRMSGLIKDLLEYSRLSLRTLQFVPVDLNAILDNVKLDFELLINQKHAIIKGDTLPVIEAISLQINQLLYNLLGNALKFTKPNVPPVITITARKISEEQKKDFPQLISSKEYCEVKVSDNGIGFNKQYDDKMFTIFQTLNEKNVYGGYGIGLALCRKIVTTHGGIIFADTNVEGGAILTFILPYTQEHYPTLHQ
jgi:PAS domain S-box-containing protein